MELKVAVLVTMTLTLMAPMMLAMVKGSKSAGRGRPASKDRPASTKKSKRQYINGPGHDPKWPFSDGVLVGNTLYISGKIGFDPKVRQAPADIDQEIQLMLGHFEDTLRQAGMTMDDLVWVQVFCTNLSLFDRFNTASRAKFKGELPARAFIGTDKILLGGHFEIMGTAVKE